MTEHLKENANCMTVIVGKNVSETGMVLLAHNEDDYVHAKVKHHFVPATDWESGAVLTAEKGLAQIPQAHHTYAYYWVQIAGPNGGLSTSDCFLNENGVCVVSDSSCGSLEDAENPNLCEHGIVYELRRAVAERAQNAKHALDLACKLVDEYGYASPGRIYFFADRNEAYMLQLVRGKSYVACKIPDDAVAIMPNHYTIHKPDECESHRVSEGLIENAIKKGWYESSDENNSSFDFAKIYQDPKTYKHAINTLRQKYATKILLGDKDDYFVPYVRTDKKISLKQLMDVMSSHYELSDVDVRFGPGLSPHDTDVRRICTGTTVEAFICEFADKPKMTTLWTAFGRPCEQFFIPIHPLNGISDLLESDEDPHIAALTHFDKKKYDTCHRAGAWQSMQNFQNLIELRYCDLSEDLRAIKDDTHSYFTKIERKSKRFESETEVKLKDTECINYALYRQEAFAKDHKLENAHIIDANIRKEDGVVKAKVSFRYDGIPKLGTMLFGPGRTETSRDYAESVIDSMIRNDSGEWTANFVFKNEPLKDDGEGEYEFFLGGRSTENETFAAMTIIRMDESGGKTIN